MKVIIMNESDFSPRRCRVYSNKATHKKIILSENYLDEFINLNKKAKKEVSGMIFDFTLEGKVPTSSQVNRINIMLKAYNPEENEEDPSFVF